jgi:four helix bundle protein
MLRLPYQKLQVWVKAMTIARETYELTKSYPTEERFGLVSQMRRAAVSICSNIAEGSQRSSDKDFAQFISIARGSLAELETQMILSQQLQMVDDERVVQVLNATDELGKMLNSFHGTLTANR